MIVAVLFWVFFVLALVGSWPAPQNPIQPYGGIFLVICVGLLGLHVFGF